MAAEVMWLNIEKNAICMRLEQNWTPDELVTAANQWHELAQTCTGSPVLVIDLSDSYRMPPGLLHHLDEVASIIPPGQYKTLIVGVSRVERTVVEGLIRTFFPTVLENLRFVDNLCEANTSLERQTQTMKQVSSQI